MSDKCGNCACASKSQCVKNGNTYGVEIIETDQSYAETFIMDVEAAEDDGKCKCGPFCPCLHCTCCC